MSRGCSARVRCGRARGHRSAALVAEHNFRRICVGCTAQFFRGCLKKSVHKATTNDKPVERARRCSTALAVRTPTTRSDSSTRALHAGRRTARAALRRDAQPSLRRALTAPRPFFLPSPMRRRSTMRSSTTGVASSASFASTCGRRARRMPVRTCASPLRASTATAAAASPWRSSRPCYESCAARRRRRPPVGF